MTKMHRYAAIAALAIFLSGCMAQRQPAPVEEVKPAPEQPAQPPQPPVVPSVPTIP
ncbi:penicillin-binding protein activator LpoB, partial [Salmonella enterica subsp. enterica serovar Agona]|nr:penicillin-binding protein activator LpoB [Salmonella enterica subsp. enterica serovar Agona]